MDRTEKLDDAQNPTMQESIFNTEASFEVTTEMVEDLKQRATRAPRGRFRICIHRSHDDLIQEMLIASVRGTYFRPHRSEVAKTKSYKVVFGELLVVFFDDNGEVVHRVEMGALGSGNPFLLRFPESNWHMPITKSEIAVYHEIRAGPYCETDLISAPWSPEGGAAAVAEYLDNLLR